MRRGIKKFSFGHNSAAQTISTYTITLSGYKNAVLRYAAVTVYIQESVTALLYDAGAFMYISKSPSGEGLTDKQTISPATNVNSSLMAYDSNKAFTGSLDLPPVVLLNGVITLKQVLANPIANCFWRTYWEIECDV